jgi:hypothetical protein
MTTTHPGHGLRIRFASDLDFPIPMRVQTSLIPK